jgi:phage-related protein
MGSAWRLAVAEWDVRFYTEGDKSPVTEFITSLPIPEQRAIARCLALLREKGTLVGHPYTSKVTGHDDLWELRPKPNRMLYYAHTGRQFIILHAFRKKSQRIPRREIDIAERRMARLLEGER